MNMTNNQIKLIYNYMKCTIEDDISIEEYKYFCRPFDSNSAWEVVQEMERKGDLSSFIILSLFEKNNGKLFIYLLNPTNFFNCFAKWLEEKENQKGGTQKAPENSHFEGAKNDSST